jgi:glycosyltransferase involved in cell wall biosynthesis
VVISAGRLAPQKDYATLLRAFAEVADARDLHLLILGKGPDRAALEAQAKKLGIEQRVFMPGFVDSPAAYMRRARAYAMSSRNEGFPMVLIEALESGTAIVSTDCHWGPREVLDGGRFGRLVPVGDAQALAAAIRDELDSDDPGPEARRSERAEWMRQYEPAVIARQYVDLVRAVIAESEPKAGDEGSS